MLSPAKYKLEKWTPTAADAAYLAAVEPTRQFLQHLPPEVIAQYAGQWIAAKDAAVIASAATRAELGEVLGDQDGELVLKMRVEKGVTIRWRRPS